MKRVLLLGDSIRMGYDEYVKELLEGEFEVVYDDADNGRFAALAGKSVFQKLRQIRRSALEQRILGHEY